MKDVGECADETCELIMAALKRAEAIWRAA
jgi:hypothetical protein